jgi:hypothetical protein
MPRAITDFFGKSQVSPIECPPQVPVIVLPDAEKTPEPSVAELSCLLKCCDISLPSPSRVKVEKSATEREIQKRKRFFQDSWLAKHSWLVLCKTRNAAFCHTCRYAVNRELMKLSDTHGGKVFSSDGFTNWRTAAHVLSQHESSSFHQDCRRAIQHNEKSRGPVDEQISTALEVNLSVTHTVVLVYCNSN